MNLTLRKIWLEEKWVAVVCRPNHAKRVVVAWPWISRAIHPWLIGLKRIEIVSCTSSLQVDFTLNVNRTWKCESSLIHKFVSFYVDNPTAISQPINDWLNGSVTPFYFGGIKPFNGTFLYKGTWPGKQEVPGGLWFAYLRCSDLAILPSITILAIR